MNALLLQRHHLSPVELVVDTDAHDIVVDRHAAASILEADPRRGEVLLVLEVDVQVLDLRGPVPVELPFGAATIRKADPPLGLRLSANAASGRISKSRVLYLRERRAGRSIDQEVPKRMTKPQSRSRKPLLLSRVAGNANRRSVAAASTLVGPGRIGLDAEHKAAAAGADQVEAGGDTAARGASRNGYAGRGERV